MNFGGRWIHQANQRSGPNEMLIRAHWPPGHCIQCALRLPGMQHSPCPTDDDRRERRHRPVGPGIDELVDDREHTGFIVTPGQFG